MFFKGLFNRKGQSTAEYAIVLGLVIAAVIGMQTYVRRGLQGRIRDAVDHVSAEADVGGTMLTFSGEQYTPYYQRSEFTTTRGSASTATVTQGGGVREDLTYEEVRGSGIEEVLRGRASNQ